jgi:hypothetical protein
MLSRQNDECFLIVLHDKGGFIELRRALEVVKPFRSTRIDWKARFSCPFSGRVLSTAEHCLSDFFRPPAL